MKSEKTARVSSFGLSRKSRIQLAALAGLSAVASLSASAQTLTFAPGAQLPIGPAYGEWNSAGIAWYNGTAFTNWGSGITNTTNAVLPGGIAELTSAEDLGVGSLTITGNTTLLPPQTGPAARVLYLNNNSVIDTGAFTLNAVANLFSGTAGGTITKTGSGVLAMHRGLASGATAAGTLAIAQGTVGFANSGSDFANGTWVNISAGATLDMALYGGPINDGFGMFSGAGNIKLGTFTNLGTNTGSTITAGTLNTGVSTWSGSISGGGRYTQVSGAGTMVFTGTNTYTGPTSIAAGTLRLESATALANTNDVYLSNVAGVQFVITTNKTIGSLGGAGATGGVVDIGANTLTVGDSNIYNGFGGNFTGTGLIVKRGTGLWTIQNTTPVSAYAGKWKVEGGVLSFGTDARMGAVPGSFQSDFFTLAGGTLANNTNGSIAVNPNRGITITADSGIYVTGTSPASINFGTSGGTLTGSGGIAKTGIGTFAVAVDNGSTYSGNWDVRDGGIMSTHASATSSQPFGTGNITLTGSTLAVVPAASGIDAVAAVASGSGKTLTYGPGAIIRLDKNTNNSLALTIGPSGASSSSLVRGTNGSLVLAVATGAGNLGTATGEKVFVNGGVTLSNGIIPGVFLTTTPSTLTVGDLASYDANGVIRATYSSTDINSAGATDTLNQTAGATLGASKTVYAVRVGDGTSGAALDLGNNTLTVGDGSANPAMFIQNTASTVANGTVAFGNSRGVIYAQGAAGNFSATITGSNGLTKVGGGTMKLATAAAYTGSTIIGQATLQVSGNNQLPTSTDLILANNGILDLQGNQQTVASLNSNNANTNIVMAAGSQLTVGSGNMTYLGAINRGATASTAAGTIVKDGSGTLALGVANSQSGGNSESLFYTKMVVKNGGVVTMGGTAALPVASQTSGVVVADTFTLDNGTLRLSQVNSAAFGSGGASTFTLSGSNTTLRGITVGAGGGTIDVVEAKEIVLFQRGNGATIGTDDAPLLSGSGTITKSGAGFLRLGIGNDASFTGKWVVKAGNLQFQDGRALGSAGSYTPDFLTLDGGMIQNNGTGTFNPNQGVTVGAGGGTLNGSWVFSQEFRGSGKLTKITTTTATFNAPSPLWTSNIDLLTGFIAANVSDALGTGTINITPMQQTGLFKLSGAADSVLTNKIVLNQGSTIDLRVDSGIGSLVLNGNISGAAGFIKTGGTGVAGQGTLVLGGNNSFAGDIVIDGGALVVNSNTALGTSAGAVMVNPGTSLVFDNASGINHATAKTTAIAGTGLSSGGAIRNVQGNNTYAGNVVVTQDASIEIPGGNLALTGSVRGASALTVNGTGSLAAGGIRVSTLNVNNPRVTITAGRSSAKTSQIGALNLGANTLDLNDNDLVVSGTTAAAIRTQIVSGQITSTVAAGQPTRALGSAQASDVLGGVYPAPFSGVQVQSGSDVLVRYTYRGDANLNGQVDSIDFGLMLAGYGATTGGTWVTGDFNYDDKVNTVDFNFLAGNFGATPIASPTPAVSLGAVVPEPASLSVIALGLVGLAGRRRRA